MKISKTKTTVLSLCLLALIGGTFAAESFRKTILPDLKHAVQHIGSIRILNENDEVARITSNNSKMVISSSTSGNFVLEQQENTNQINGWSSMSSILWWQDNALDAKASTVLAWSENENRSNYSLIWWGKRNKIEGQQLNIILWWVGNKILSGNYSTIVWWSENEIQGESSATIGKKNLIVWDRSVALGSWATVKADNTFLWTDKWATITESDVFAIISDHGMVVNTDSAHDFAQLTIGGSLIVGASENDQNIVCAWWEGKWVMKLVKKNEEQKCLCSCDGNQWYSLMWEWQCQWVCQESEEENGINEGAPKCGTMFSFLTDWDGKKYFQWSCETWNVISGSYHMIWASIYWACQNAGGEVVSCHSDMFKCGWSIPENASPNNNITPNSAYEYHLSSNLWEVCTYSCNEWYAWKDDTEKCQKICSTSMDLNGTQLCGVWTWTGNWNPTLTNSYTYLCVHNGTNYQCNGQCADWKIWVWKEQWCINSSTHNICGSEQNTCNFWATVKNQTTTETTYKWDCYSPNNTLLASCEKPKPWTNSKCNPGTNGCYNGTYSPWTATESQSYTYYCDSDICEWKCATGTVWNGGECVNPANTVLCTSNNQSLKDICNFGSTKISDRYDSQNYYWKCRVYTLEKECSYPVCNNPNYSRNGHYYNVSNLHEGQSTTISSTDWKCTATVSCWWWRTISIGNVDCPGEQYSCTWGIPANTNTHEWTPTANTARHYNASLSDPCSFNCKTNYTWNWTTSQCVANTTTGTCTWLPANATWAKNTFVRTWNGSAWIPSSVSPSCVTSSSSSVDCSFTCNTNYKCNTAKTACEVATTPQCTNLPDLAIANNSYTPSVNTPYTYSTNASEVCTYSCKANAHYVNGQWCICNSTFIQAWNECICPAGYHKEWTQCVKDYSCQWTEPTIYDSISHEEPTDNSTYRECVGEGYQSNLAACTYTCDSDDYTCQNGNCIKIPRASCTWPCGSTAHGYSLTCYKYSSVSCPDTCRSQSQTSTCYDWVWSDAFDPSYIFSNCSIANDCVDYPLTYQRDPNAIYAWCKYYKYGCHSYENRYKFIKCKDGYIYNAQRDECQLAPPSNNPCSSATVNGYNLSSGNHGDTQTATKTSSCSSSSQQFECNNWSWISKGNETTTQACNSNGGCNLGLTPTGKACTADRSGFTYKCGSCNCSKNCTPVTQYCDGGDCVENNKLLCYNWDTPGTCRNNYATSSSVIQSNWYYKRTCTLNDRTDSCQTPIPTSNCPSWSMIYAYDPIDVFTNSALSINQNWSHTISESIPKGVKKTTYRYQCVNDPDNRCIYAETPVCVTLINSDVTLTCSAGYVPNPSKTECVLEWWSCQPAFNDDWPSSSEEVVSYTACQYVNCSNLTTEFNCNDVTNWSYNRIIVWNHELHPWIRHPQIYWSCQWQEFEECPWPNFDETCHKCVHCCAWGENQGIIQPPQWQW